MKQNPCRYCVMSWEHNGQHYPSYEKQCCDCENIKKHRAYLQKCRMFSEGESISDLNELLQQEWVMWHHQTRHIEMIKSMQLRTVLLFLNGGAFHRAVRKERGEK